MSKRVYKFLSAQHGINNLRDRRLKLATIDDLNDPFDLVVSKYPISLKTESVTGVAPR